MQAHPITSPKAAMDFVLGGNARFTLRSTVTGSRYTFRVRKSKDGGIYFVSLMTGPDNDSHFTYLGYIKNGKLSWSKKSGYAASSTPFRAISWALAQMGAGNLPKTLEVWHDGRCGRCGRTLTVPESLASGFGPECIHHVH